MVSPLVGWFEENRRVPFARQWFNEGLDTTAR
jgi:hypothetical protein